MDNKQYALEDTLRPIHPDVGEDRPDDEQKVEATELPAGEGGENTPDPDGFQRDVSLSMLATTDVNRGKGVERVCVSFEGSNDRQGRRFEGHLKLEYPIGDRFLNRMARDLSQMATEAIPHRGTPPDCDQPRAEATPPLADLNLMGRSVEITLAIKDGIPVFRPFLVVEESGGPANLLSGWVLVDPRDHLLTGDPAPYAGPLWQTGVDYDGEVLAAGTWHFSFQGSGQQAA